MDSYDANDAECYGTPPSYLEKVQSQLPALQLLVQMGWEYLTPAAADLLRGGRLGGVILEPVLAEFIRGATYEFKGGTRRFTENAIENAVQTLKNFRATGAMCLNEEVYDLLCLGTSVPQTVEGDTKSFTIQYVDWQRPERNRLHCTAEFRVERVGQETHYIPDLVLFVNGIPLAVIECKRSAYTDLRKQPVELAIEQLRDYQGRDGIPQLFLYSQLLMVLARDKAEYGTTGTPREFWTVWKEENLDDAIRQLLERKPSVEIQEKLSAAPFDSTQVQEAFLGLLTQGREVYEQDRLLYALCRPERLLTLVYQFILFDNGLKKVARYQQFFTTQDVLERVLSAPDDATRPGGVVWHTQGSGKSLTMVMLAKSLALAIPNAKIILVTDRIDLDDQICGTFHACGMKPEQATTGRHLIELLRDGRAHVVTTLIHKFTAATANRDLREVDRDTFVLVDEGHRGQYNEQHARMRLALKGACFIAFTGTPLAKSAQRNTFTQFGKLFQPPYTIARAIEDKTVVPLLYEARHVPQTVERAAIDNWFEKVTAGLNESQRADLKRKFSSERQLNKALQKVRMIAWDVGMHYSSTFQGTGLKGQLVTPDKATALLYKRFMDEFGTVKTEVLISAPMEREGDTDSTTPEETEKTFWKGMMERYGTEKTYNEQLINAFKRADEPEIIIVVDKLLTGFDAPCNAVLYLARKLKEHTLLQAIARVNRLHPQKEYGLILDYSGVIEELDEAIDFYSQLAEYDTADLEQTVTLVAEKVKALPGQHAAVWALLAPVKRSADMEPYEVFLRDDAVRNQFYDRFSTFARTLGLALSSSRFLEETPAKTIARYKDDLKFFQNLRAAVSVRYQESIRFGEYEPRIKKLLDTHVGAGEVQQLCDPINLLDAAARAQVLDDQGKNTEAKADMIAAATRHVIEQEMAKDPAFYKKFSRLLEDTLLAYRTGRLVALEALKNIKDIATKVATHTDDQTPRMLKGHGMAQRFYGCICEPMQPYGDAVETLCAEIALAVTARLKPHKIRDWRTNLDALNRMRGEIDDILFEYTGKQSINIPMEQHDAIIDRCLEIAIANED